MPAAGLLVPVIHDRARSTPALCVGRLRPVRVLPPLRSGPAGAGLESGDGLGSCEVSPDKRTANSIAIIRNNNFRRMTFLLLSWIEAGLVLFKVARKRGLSFLRLGLPNELERPHLLKLGLRRPMPFVRSLQFPVVVLVRLIRSSPDACGELLVWHIIGNECLK